MESHFKKWSSCRACSIGKSNVRVFHRGKLKNPKYLFIGEAPGPSECVTRKPFTGRSGNLLTMLFDDVGITDFAITNVIACFPSQDDDKSKFRAPSKEEIASCKPRLDEYIEIVRPQYLISLGVNAKKHPPTGMEYSLHLDHPSFILRNGGEHSIEYKRNRHRLIKFLKETR